MVRLFNKSKGDKPVSNNPANTRIDAIYARLRRLDERLRALEDIASVLKRDVSRIDRMGYRTIAKNRKDGQPREREYSIGEVVDGL